MKSLTYSFAFDAVLLACDLSVNRAWAEALRRVRVLTDREAKRIQRGLARMEREADALLRQADRAAWEDVHTFVEVTLHRRVGDVAKKLHAGKSRNDQVATDLRMYVKELLTRLDGLLRGLIAALLEKAEAHAQTPFPAYTHMRQAQPTVFGHYLMAYVAAVERDREDLRVRYNETDVLPLGSGAVSGSGFPVDRRLLARRLGFRGISANSIDAVGDRDFVLGFHLWAARLMIHLSRMAEDLIVWSSDEARLVRLPQEFCTGSSLMPQKLNPDVAELVRGKTARVIGHAVQAMALLKGLPSSYDRDLQEDKEALFDSARTVQDCVAVWTGLVRGVEVDEKRARGFFQSGFSLATDLADALVRERGVPFREAHHIVGRVVRWCLDNHWRLGDVPADVLADISPQVDSKLLKGLGLESALASRDLTGGTAPKQVRSQIRAARRRLSRVLRGAQVP
ncbi:MAG: argininosuccinate lyase [Nitrospirae bacterium]|nr:argininosuccinate lyase [Nitrospirota bacterium]